MTESASASSRQDIVIPEPTLRRIPTYCQYLKGCQERGEPAITSAAMAADLSLNPIQIRKDLEAIGAAGRPRTGYDVDALVSLMEEFLGYNNVKDAVLAGAGHLGQALLAYEGFEEYGLKIVAAFDADPDKAGATVAGRKIFPADRLEEMVRRLRIRIGILTVPADRAQDVCDRMVAGGVRAVWNFTPHSVSVPDGVIVQHENMATSLAVLANRLEVVMRRTKEQHHESK